jgi:hypothetical protein
MAMDLELSPIRAGIAASDFGPAVVVLACLAEPPDEMNPLLPSAIEVERLST